MITFKEFTQKYHLNEGRELTSDQEREFKEHQKRSVSLPHTEDHYHSYDKTHGYTTASYIHTNDLEHLHDHLKKNGYHHAVEHNGFGAKLHVYSHPDKKGEKITIQHDHDDGYHEVVSSSPISKGEPTQKDKIAATKRKHTIAMKKMGALNRSVYD